MAAKLLIAFEGVLAQRNSSKFSLETQCQLYASFVASKAQDAEESKETITNLSKLLSPEGRLASGSSPSLLDDFYSSEEFSSQVEVQFLPNAKKCLQNLKHFERILVIQSVSMERAQILVGKVKAELDGLIDQYLYIPGIEGALNEALPASLSHLGVLQDSFFLTNSFAQLEQVQTLQNMTPIFFARQPRNYNPKKCSYAYSCMTWLNFQRLVTLTIPSFKASKKVTTVGVIHSGHPNDISKQESQNGKGYLVNTAELYFPILWLQTPPELQETKIDLIVHKLPYHFTPHALKHDSEAMKLKLQDISKYSQKYKFYEEIDKLRIVGSRGQFKQVIADILPSLKNKSVALSQPRWFMLHEQHHEFSLKSLDYILASMKQQQIKFPLVAQSDNATTHKAAHNLAIVKSVKGLQKLLESDYYAFPRDGPELIFSQFKEHDSILLKVYLAGRDYYATRVDPSISVQEVDEDDVFYIDTAGKKKGLGEKSYPGEPEELEGLKQMVTELVERTGIKLAGLDILRSDGVFYIIDLNHYPSYANLEGFSQALEKIVLEAGSGGAEIREIVADLD